ncbi:Emc10p Ecym_7427 [Eremothecium cymbalariae DBVPG|uniref:ER membrane protein complex subunit 10 n=1 Tax=Eremothecium cymbalariae (strain CBS 270.75 / DBVPG 7215 / KCTC 17166 / NRRL Y-17582) TaxID=931890 RepID=G8JWN5_ERECY|nr:hypothetical protein Ecym_7427 [Eremothecium cymbalariae DBVPG\
MLLWVISIQSVLSHASKEPIVLYAETVTTKEKHPLCSLVYFHETETSPEHYQVIDVNNDLPPGPYCVGAAINNKPYACHAYLTLETPLDYDLHIHRDTNKTPYKLSLTTNPEASGIIPIITDSKPGPQAAIKKLKKSTKTYQDKRANSGSATASFGEGSEPDKRSFIQKNWKLILLGILVYALFNRKPEES